MTAIPPRHTAEVTPPATAVAHAQWYAVFPDLVSLHPFSFAMFAAVTELDTHVPAVNAAVRPRIAKTFTRADIFQCFFDKSIKFCGRNKNKMSSWLEYIPGYGWFRGRGQRPQKRSRWSDIAAEVRGYEDPKKPPERIKARIFEVARELVEQKAMDDYLKMLRESNYVPYRRGMENDKPLNPLEARGSLSSTRDKKRAKVLKGIKML